MHTADNSVSSYSSLPTGALINHNRRSSTGNTNTPTNSSSKSADNLFETKPSSNPHDELKNQLEENLYLTQEVLDLKMQLANAMAQIDAEKHTNRLQAEQISHLYDDNDELKCYLDQAYERIAELESGNRNNTQHHANTNLCESASSTRPNEGWLHRVASTISMANNSTSSSTNLCADSQAQRKDAASPSNTVSTQSTMTLMERSTRRLSMLSLGSSLADEELPASFKDRRSSMYSFERRLSMYSSLSTFREEDKEEKGTADDSDDDWLDEGVALPDDIEQVTFAARNA